MRPALARNREAAPVPRASSRSAATPTTTSATVSPSSFRSIRAPCAGASPVVVSCTVPIPAIPLPNTSPVAPHVLGSPAPSTTWPVTPSPPASASTPSPASAAGVAPTVTHCTPRQGPRTADTARSARLKESRRTGYWLAGWLRQITGRDGTRPRRKPRPGTRLIVVQRRIRPLDSLGLESPGARARAALARSDWWNDRVASSG